jgi:hypothetical protein
MGRLPSLRLYPRRPTMMFENPTWFCSAIVPSEFPLGPEHLDSDLCWCDPIIDTDTDGLEIILHRSVTWN